MINTSNGVSATPPPSPAPQSTALEMDCENWIQRMVRRTLFFASPDRETAISTAPLPASFSDVRIDVDFGTAHYKQQDGSVVGLNRLTNPDGYDALVSYQKVVDHRGVIDPPNTAVPRVAYNVVATSQSVQYHDGVGVVHWANAATNPALHAALSVPACQSDVVFDTPTVNVSKLQAGWTLGATLPTYKPTREPSFDVRVLGFEGISDEQAVLVNQLVAQSPTLVVRLQQAAADGIKVTFGPESYFSSDEKLLVLPSAVDMAGGVWGAESPEHVAVLTTGILVYHLGHANRSRAAVRPVALNYANAQDYAQAYVHWAANRDGDKLYDAMVIADETLNSSGFSMPVANFVYDGSAFQAVMRNPALSEADRRNWAIAVQYELQRDALAPGGETHAQGVAFFESSVADYIAQSPFKVPLTSTAPLPASFSTVQVDSASQTAQYKQPDGSLVGLSRFTNPDAFAALVQHQAVTDDKGVIDPPATAVPAVAYNVVVTPQSVRYHDSVGVMHWVGAARHPALYAALSVPAEKSDIVFDHPSVGQPEDTYRWTAEAALKSFKPTLKPSFDVRTWGLKGLSEAQLDLMNQVVAQSPTFVAQLEQAAADGVKIVFGVGGYYEHGTDTVVVPSLDFLEKEWNISSPDYVAIELLEVVTHELGHGRDPAYEPGAGPRSDSLPDFTAYASAEAFAKDYVPWAARREGEAQYNSMLIADEIIDNSGLSMPMSAQGYRESSFDDVFNDDTLSIAEKKAWTTVTEYDLHREYLRSKGKAYKQGLAYYDSLVRNYTVLSPFEVPTTSTAPLPAAFSEVQVDPNSHTAQYTKPDGSKVALNSVTNPGAYSALLQYQEVLAAQGVIDPPGTAVPQGVDRVVSSPQSVQYRDSAGVLHWAGAASNPAVHVALSAPPEKRDDGGAVAKPTAVVVG